MKRYLRNLANLLFGVSVLSAFLLDTSVATGSVSSSAIASTNPIKSDSVELARGNINYYMSITCPTDDRDPYVITLGYDETNWYYWSKGLFLSSRVEDVNLESEALGYNVYHFFNNDFEYEVIPDAATGGEGRNYSHNQRVEI
ncbi:hypothetical protein HC928_10280 [bacterium]|nr:hypothetical protein [bacterium]